MFNIFKDKRYLRAMKQTGLIVGTGRCGTTILASVLNAHSKICVPHELQFIINRGLYEKYLSGEAQRYTADDFINFIKERCPYCFEQYFDYITHFRKLSYPQIDLSVLLTELFDHICYDASKEILLEQTPWYGLHLETLKDLFIDMKVIHVIRDGRDVAISYARTPWWSKDIMANLERWEGKVKAIHTFCSDHPENTIELRYEDLVVHPEKELLKILQLFGLDYEEKMLDPAFLVDYLSFFKGDGLAVQSDQYKRWGHEQRSVFFTESIYGWKKVQDDTFAVLPEKVKNTLELFGYET